VHVTRGPSGPKLYVVGHRCHHGMFGVGVVVVAQHLHSTPIRVAATLVGLCLVLHDWPDFPWLSDTDHLTFNVRH
jgi:hypothetical protein